MTTVGSNATTRTAGTQTPTLYVDPTFLATAASTATTTFLTLLSSEEHGGGGVSVFPPLSVSAATPTVVSDCRNVSSIANKNIVDEDPSLAATATAAATTPAAKHHPTDCSNQTKATIFSPKSRSAAEALSTLFATAAPRRCFPGSDDKTFAATESSPPQANNNNNDNDATASPTAESTSTQGTPQANDTNTNSSNVTMAPTPPMMSNNFPGQQHPYNRRQQQQQQQQYPPPTPNSNNNNNSQMMPYPPSNNPTNNTDSGSPPGGFFNNINSGYTPYPQQQHSFSSSPTWGTPMQVATNKFMPTPHHPSMNTRGPSPSPHHHHHHHHGGGFAWQNSHPPPPGPMLYQQQQQQQQHHHSSYGGLPPTQPPITTAMKDGNDQNSAVRLASNNKSLVTPTPKKTKLNDFPRRHGPPNGMLMQGPPPPGHHHHHHGYLPPPPRPPQMSTHTMMQHHHHHPGMHPPTNYGNAYSCAAAGGGPNHGHGNNSNIDNHHHPSAVFSLPTPQQQHSAKSQQQPPTTTTTDPSADANTDFDGYSRKKKSLGVLAENFLQRYENCAPGAEVIVDEAAIELGVERRRIYDVVNILESIQLVVKKGKNTYSWLGKDCLPDVFGKLQATAIIEYPEDAKKYGLVMDGLEGDIEDGVPGKTGEQGGTITRRSSVSSIASEDSKSQFRSLAKLSQQFLQVFLVGYDILSLPQASEMIQGTLSVEAYAAIGSAHAHLSNRYDPNAGTPPSLENPQEFRRAAQRGLKTKIRRLYDIANVFLSVGLLRKVDNSPGSGNSTDAMASSRRPNFQWAFHMSPRQIQESFIAQRLERTPLRSIAPQQAQWSVSNSGSSDLTSKTTPITAGGNVMGPPDSDVTKDSNDINETSPSGDSIGTPSEENTNPFSSNAENGHCNLLANIHQSGGAFHPSYLASSDAPPTTPGLFRRHSLPTQTQSNATSVASSSQQD